MNKPVILHIVIDLSGFGGAEMTLLRYLEGLGADRLHHRIVTLRRLKPGPSVGARLDDLGITIDQLAIEHLHDLPRGILHLLRLIKSLKPDCLSAWLYYPALLATLLRPILPGKPRVVWHIRSLPFGGLTQKPFRYVTQRCLALLSSLSFVKIISNSEAAKRAHARIGYDVTRWSVVANAIDPDQYKPDHDARRTIRHELGVHDHQLVIGSVGRDVPEKAWPDLFAAFARLRNNAPDADHYHLVIAGRGLTSDAHAMRVLMNRHNLPASSVSFLGARHDIPKLMNGFDLFILASRSESFPNVLAEAMATGLVAIATDVGDCRKVLDDDRMIALPGNADALYDVIKFSISLDAQEKQRLSEKNRLRVRNFYSQEKMVKGFDIILHS